MIAASFIPLEDRAFVSVSVDLSGDHAAALAEGLDETDIIAAYIAEKLPLTDAIVRVSYSATEEQHRRVDSTSLIKMIDNAGAHKLFGGIQWRPVRSSRVRAAGADETLAPLAALDLWLGAQEGVSEGSAAGLRELLREWVTA